MAATVSGNADRPPYGEPPSAPALSRAPGTSTQRRDLAPGSVPIRQVPQPDASATFDLHPLDHDVLQGPVLIGPGGRDLVDDLAGRLVGHLAEDRVLEVEVRGRRHGDEE